MTAKAKREDRADPRDHFKDAQSTLRDLREELALSVALRPRTVPLTGASAALMMLIEKGVGPLARKLAERDGVPGAPDARALQEAKQTLLKDAIREIEGQRIGRFIRARVR